MTGTATARMSLEDFLLISWAKSVLRTPWNSIGHFADLTRTFAVTFLFLLPRTKLYTPAGSSCWRRLHWRRSELDQVLFLFVDILCPGSKVFRGR